MSYQIKNASTVYPLLFLMVQSSDHMTGLVGLTPTVTLRKPGGTFAAPAGAVTEVGNGWYQVAGNATDTNTNGPLILHATGTAADPVDMVFEVVAFNPQSATVDVGSIATGAVTAAAIAASALNGKGDWNIGKTGYALTQAFPTNFSALSISAGGLTDILQAAADKAWGTTSRLLTAGTNIVLAKGTGMTGLNDLDEAAAATAVWNAATITYGSAGSYGLTVKTNLDATISSRLATSGYTAADNSGITAIKAKTDNLPSDPASNTQVNTRLAAAGYTAPSNATITLIAGYVDELESRLTSGRAANLDFLDVAVSSVGGGAAPTAAAIADAVWDEAISGHVAAGSTGQSLAGAGAAGDPWTAPLPGSYGAGSAGKLLADNLNATVSSRLSTSGYTAPDNTSITSTASVVTAVASAVASIPTNPLLTNDVRLDRIQAILFGLVSGAGTGIESFSHNGRTVRVTADVNGNRTLIELL